MEGQNSLDPIDRLILRILSHYDNLEVLQLWYEFGGCEGSMEHMSQEEVLSSLEFLRSPGFVEPVTKGEGEIRWALTIKGEAKR